MPRGWPFYSLEWGPASARVYKSQPSTDLFLPFLYTIQPTFAAFVVHTIA